MRASEPLNSTGSTIDDPASSTDAISARTAGDPSSSTYSLIKLLVSK